MLFHRNTEAYCIGAIDKSHQKIQIEAHMQYPARKRMRFLGKVHKMIQKDRKFAKGICARAPKVTSSEKRGLVRDAKGVNWLKGGLTSCFTVGAKILKICHNTIFH